MNALIHVDVCSGIGAFGIAAAWTHIDNLNTLTGEMRWYAEKI